MIRWTAPFTLIAMLLVAPAANATLVLDLDLPTLTEEATHVIHADVIASHSRSVEGRFITEVKLRVRDHIKRSQRLPQGDAITIETPGGTVGELTQMVPGTPVLRPGDEVLLFLWQREEETRPRILGLAQGAWQVTRSEKGAEARRDRRGIGRVHPTTRAILEHPDDDPLDHIELNMLKSRIRSHATEDGPSR